MLKGRGRTKATWFKDLTGVRFGRLTVVSFARREGDRVDGRRGGVRYLWTCRCDCGGVVDVAGDKLRSKARPTRSCGCLTVEATRERRLTHGHTVGGTMTAEYRAWWNMISRCAAPENSRFADYGGRGITICDEWRNSFECFLADMGHRPSRRHSIDRIDVNGNYKPDNCRWATPREQSENKRSTRLVILNGEEMTVTEASRRTGIGVGTLSRRISGGWPAADLFAPTNQRHYHRKRK